MAKGKRIRVAQIECGSCGGWAGHIQEGVYLNRHTKQAAVVVLTVTRGSLRMTEESTRRFMQDTRSGHDWN